MSIGLTQAAVGDLVAQYDTGPISRERLQAYAQASGDLNPLHLDPAFAQKAGFDDVIVHGMLGMALLGRLLTGPLGAHPLRAFNARFGAVIPVGCALHCRAYLDAIESDGYRLRLEAADDHGTVTIGGQAIVGASVR